MGCELVTPPTLPTSAGEGSLTGQVDSGEYLAPQSYRRHGVGNVRESSRSAHEGPIHDDMIDKILTVLPRGNIYQPPLVPGDDTETLSIRERRGKSTYPSDPLKVHNWPNPVNSMAKDSKRDSQTVQFSGKPAPDLGQGSEYCVERSARSRKGGYSGDRNRDSSSVAGGYLPADDSKDQERGHVSQCSSFAVTSGPHTVVDSQFPVTGTHQPVFPYHQSYVSQREDPCHGQAYQSLTKPKVGDYRNQSSTTHPIVSESGYPSNMLNSNCWCPPQVEKSFGPRDGNVQVQGDHLLSSHRHPSNQVIPPSYPTYLTNQYSIHAYREHPAAYGNPPMYRPSHHLGHSPVTMPSHNQWDVHPSLPRNVHMPPNSKGYPLATDSFQGATPRMMNMPRDSQDAKGHSSVQRNVSTPLTSHNKGSASAQSVRASDNSVHRGRHSAGQEQRQRESSSSSSEERQQSQRQSVTRDDRHGSNSSSTEDSDPRQGKK